MSRYLNGHALPPWDVVENLCKLVGSPTTEARTLWERAHAIMPDGVQPTPRSAETGPVRPATHILQRRWRGLCTGGLVTAVLLFGLGIWLTHDASGDAEPDAGPPEAIMLVNALIGLADGAHYVVDIANWSQDEGAPAHLWHWRYDTHNDIRNQLWLVEPASSGGIRFRNVLSNRCLTVSPAADLVQSDCTDAPAQTWRHTAQAQLENRATPRCLDVKGSQLNDGEALLMATCSDSPTQRWTLQPRTG